MGIKLWMSGEIMREISRDFQSAESDIETAINSVLDASDYGDGIVKWYHIPIILDFDDSDFCELKRYSRKKRQAEFRLRIPYMLFKESDSRTQRKLIMDMILRSIDEMKAMGIPNFDLQKLESDMRELAAAKRWD